ncbi:MAG TPA: universal stress protein [Nocardioides sp.]|nr:universal stress protein [Nocardioides sp.]
MNQIQPGSIVVAVDGSPDADRAVLWAAEQAHLERRPLAIVTAVPDGDAANDAAVAVARRWRPGLEAHGAVVEGAPRQVLRDLSTQAHLMVLGSRGRGPVGSAVLGSVSSSVSKHAGCTVVVCRPGTVGRVHHGILVAADGMPGSLPVIEFAFRQASLRSLPLTVVNAAGEDDPLAGVLLAESVAGFGELFPEVHVSRDLGRDFGDETRPTESGHWDMVVVGRPHAESTRRRTGPTATQVVEHAHTLVAVVPEAPDQEPAATGTNDPAFSAPRP